MIEKLTECSKSQFEKGIDCVDTHEMKEAVCMIKELAEAEYYSKISKAMDESSNGDIMDMHDYYNDNRYYDRYRYSNGRFAPKGRGTRRGYDEPRMYVSEDMRDMDLHSGRMYYPDVAREMRTHTESGRGGNFYENRNYTEPNYNNESRMERNRRTYEEHMKKHDTSPEGKKKEMELLAELIDSATDVMMAYKSDMDAATKTMMAKKFDTAKTKITQ